jgi:RNA polymerase sigma-70 factor (sigma-E family)
VEFDRFVAERQRSLFRFAVVLSGDPHLAEELVQSVLARAFERWSQVAAADDRNAYVRRMLVNEYISWRRVAIRSTPVAEFFDEQLADEPDHADRYSQAAELAEELDRLPRKQRAVLVLRFYAGMSFAEVAACLGCREATARAYATRALATLRIDMETRSLSLSAAEKEF